MVFSSAVFLFAFLPIVLILHTFIPKIFIKNILLIVASLFFYGWGEPAYVILLLVSVTVNYFTGKVAAGGKESGDRRAHIAIVLSVVFNIGMLVVFKYTGFLVELINYIPMVNIPVPDIRMPIGISFYTFQAMSYCIDVYRDKDAGPAGFIDVMVYILLFPQLVAGPIVKYNSISSQLKSRTISARNIQEGVTRFIYGLSKKMLLANTLAVGADHCFGLGASLDSWSAWLGAVCYMLQIYFDFSGYSDMAVGMGKMFGFNFPENFNYPYIATSIRDFWKRWHISLTSWFREYLYFSIGGNRISKTRTMLNRFFVFVCTGIWHGANFTFLLWGIYHGVLTMIETALENKKQRQSAGIVSALKNIFGHIYTLLAVLIGFVIFRADSLGQAFSYIGTMFSFTGTAVGTMEALSLLNPLFIITLILAVVFAMPVTKIVKNKKLKFYGGLAVSLILYLLCILEIAAGSYNPFIYFRF
ncbi:MAG: MBOAT family O-acyltransferase [Lachnospiraceae bacterium]